MDSIDPGQFFVITAMCIAAAGGGLFFFFRNHFRARLIEDMPTSKIRSAAQGYVELIGFAKLMEGEPIVSPLTRLRCCWWRYKIERRGQKNGWHTVESGSSDSPFLMEDDTGLCIIDPEGAHVIPWENKVWYGHEKYPSKEPINHSFNFSIGGLNMGSGRYRYTEAFIYEDNPLYAVGYFRSMDEFDHRESRHELMRGILKEWKQDKGKLLARFDRNGDGKIDLEEWDEARKMAAKLARKEQQEIERNQIPHILTKPRDRRQPYILATKEQDELTKGLRLWGYAALALGLTGSIASLYLLISRFGQ